MSIRFGKLNTTRITSAKLRHYTKNGMLAIFASLFIAQLLPFLLRVIFFTAKSVNLSSGVQGAIVLITILGCDAFLSGALLRIGRKEVTFESVLFAAIRLLILVAPGAYLEIRLFRNAFADGSCLPKSLFWALVVPVICILTVHTSFWICSILSEDTHLLPDSGLWLSAWKTMLRNLVGVLLSVVLVLLLFWCSLIAFPLFSETVLSFFYRSVPGTVFLSLLFSFLLTFVLHILFRIAMKIMLSGQSSGEDVPDEEKTDDLIPSFPEPEKEYEKLCRNNPSSAEEILIERDLLRKDLAFQKPARVITDNDLAKPVELVSRALTALDLIPVFFLVLLAGYLAIFSVLSRTTCADVISGIEDDTVRLAEEYRKEGLTREASDAYSGGLADLEAIDAYLCAVEGGVANEALNEETAQVDVYGKIFDLAQEYAPNSSFPYVLEAKLLLTDGHPDLASTVLLEMVDKDIMTDEAYLLLLRSYKECGLKGTDSYKEVRNYCISHRIFTDDLSYLDSVNVSSAGVLSDSLQAIKDDFYLYSQLLLWQAYREEGEIETAYSGLYTLLQDERYNENLTVLRAFVETGALFHIRLDGSTDKIETYYKITAEEAQRYDRLYINARAAGEEETYTLLETKIFVSGCLVSCKQYEYACSYLEDALHRYSDSEELIELFKEAYSNLTDDQKKQITYLDLLNLIQGD